MPLSNRNFNDFLESSFSLKSRPEPVPGDLRIIWGVSVVVLILFHSRAKQATFEKLHFFTYSIRTLESRRRTLALFETKSAASKHTIRFEPWLNRAIGFAKGADLLLLQSGKRARLTAKGIEFADEIMAKSDSLVSEIDFIKSVSKNVSEAFVTDMLRREKLL